ncbi:unnamed protein product [Lathyrus sativus]|nr:unnamed protein product [Lathyrus sativus]
MIATSTVSYRFNINRDYSYVLPARRGIRQWDPISPLLFVIMMRCMNIIMVKIHKDPNFNHHAKCEKLALTHPTFVDDVLLFSRGDQKSMEMINGAFKKFYESTWLIVNPSKCKIYYGGVDNTTKEALLNVIGFEEGQLPVRYLGLPLS